MNNCDVCKNSLSGRCSYDFYLSMTSYDGDGEPLKTGWEPGEDFTDRDYVTICDREGCQGVAKTLWSRMTSMFN